MWRSFKALLIDDDDSRRHDLHVILNFVGEGAVAVTSEQWESVLTNEETGVDGFLCAFVGQVPGTLVDQIKHMKRVCPTLPIVTIDREAGVESVEEEGPKCVIANLVFPPKYTKLLDTLHRAQIFRESMFDDSVRRQRREAQLFRSLVGTSRAIVKVRELMAQVADKDVNVLITGESGTGKEVVARNLHYNSHRRHKPFVPVNCGAIPAELLESELFGHEKGAFTGAVVARPGRFELAEGGTLFLDEIGDMPLHMQVKILRVLQERTYERVGGAKTHSADVRIIAATHRNLMEHIEDGTFREDLYYRLNVFPIEMPALRERPEDIPLLLNDLIARIENEKRGSIRFNSASIMALCRHDWPGNVRELANLVERLVITHPYGVIGANELPARFRHVDEADEIEHEVQGHMAPAVAGMEQMALLPVNGLDLKAYLGHLESSLIQQALDECNGIVARAAEKLRVRRTTLVEKMRKYDMLSKK